MAKRLRPEGFYVVNAVDSRQDALFVAALVRTLALDFQAVEVWLDDDAEGALAGTSTRATFIIVASQSRYGSDVLYSAFGIRRTWRLVPTDQLRGIADATAPILTDDFAPVERLMGGILYAPIGPARE